MTTPNLSLPELAASQSQPHVTHNTALRTLDALTQLAVLSQVTEVPLGPSEGDRYLIDAGSPTPELERSIAAYSGGAWAYFAPQAGWLCWVIDERALYVFDDSFSPGEWAVLASLP
jgi:hypothetical protein